MIKNSKTDKENSSRKDSAKTPQHVETRHVVIYGYTRQELAKVIRHFEDQLPDFVKINIDSSNMVTKVTLTGINSGVELLRFQMNKYQQTLNDIFSHEVVSTEDKTIAEVMGDLLRERELSISCAESCTGGNIAHLITQVPGSSSYFLGSIVSYSNEVKTDVLKVNRSDIHRYGPVSRQIVEQMSKGVAELMHTDCAIATSGIAGPNGGTKYKPVGTVWIAVKYSEKIVTECLHFKGDRRQVIQSASDHAMVMLVNLLRDCYEMQEEFNDE